MFFMDEIFKTCFAFYFLALETLFWNTEIGKSNPEIAINSLKITVSHKIMFAFQPNKLGQIYVQ